MYTRAISWLGALAVTLMLTGLAAAVTLNIHNGGDPGSLDPHKVTGIWENRILGDIFEGLLAEDASGGPIPGQAESWTISEDGLVYTFKLRDGILWTDGTPVTAHDFVFAFQRLMDPETAAIYAHLQYPIKNAEKVNSGELTDLAMLGVKALDDKTLEITLEQPTPYFLGALAHYTAYPVPKHVVEAKGSDWVRIENIVTNGPYRPTEWVPGSHVSTVKNEDHYDTANVSIENVKFFALADASAALKRYRAGDFDILTEFPTDQYEWMLENLPGQVQLAPYAGLYYFSFNTQRPPFDNVDVRKALSMAVNREIIGTHILGTGEIPAYSWVPPGMANYGEGPTFDWKDFGYPERVAMAQQLIEGVGFGPDNPLNVQLRYNTNENHRRISVAVAAMWKPLGVEVELFNTEIKVHYSELEKGEFEVARAGWLADYNDADNFLNLLKSGVNHNYGRYSNALFDQLLEDANRERDPDKRADLLKMAEKIALDDHATLPIYYFLARNVVSPRVKGFRNNAFDVHRTRWMSIDE